MVSCIEPAVPSHRVPPRSRPFVSDSSRLRVALQRVLCCGAMLYCMGVGAPRGRGTTQGELPRGKTQKRGVHNTVESTEIGGN